MASAFPTLPVSDARRWGFTLVELSIVLVIIGLLTGGVLTGQSLIHAAELRSVTSQTLRYTSAVYTFRDKYFGMPGDITNATKYWGTDPGGCPTHASAGAITATCDGNGDGYISLNDEEFRAWQQLADAGLIEGSYTGVTGTRSTVDSQPAVNVPQLRLNVIYGISYFGGPGAVTPTGSYMFPGSYGNMFVIGKCSGRECADAAFIPEDAYNIDVKLDDGKPGTGKLVTRVGNGSNGLSGACNTAADDSYASQSSATYSLTVTAPACAFYYQGT